MPPRQPDNAGLRPSKLIIMKMSFGDCPVRLEVGDQADQLVFETMRPG